MIKEFKSGKWYRLSPEGVKHISWNNEGDMNFLKDFKYHQCNRGRDYFASFYDCKVPSYDWSFNKALSFFDERDNGKMNLMDLELK
jgi:hypothetical protein